MGKIGVGPSAASYYLDQVAQGREDYYDAEGEEPGRWVGSVAAPLRRSGEVEGDDFVSLLAGAGVRRHRADGVAGFDLTFRAPKSVSVAWAIADDWVGRELRAGHDAAITEALGYLERQACRGRRGKDGLEQVSGRGFAGAAFVHRSSRAGDPLLHTHVVVGNLTQGPDGRWTALDARHLYRHLKTAGFLYQAALRRELSDRLGLEWTQVREGVSDLEAVPRGVIEHFSQRRTEILEHMAAHGGRSAGSAQIAALETRRAKEVRPLGELRADWTARAAEHGLTRQAFEDLVGRDRTPRGPAPSPLPADSTLALTAEGVTEQASTFGRAELLQHLAAEQARGARVSDLEQAADRLLARQEVVQLKDGLAPAGVTEHRYSTRELLEVEAGLLERAEVGQQLDWAPAVGADRVDEHLNDHPTLSLEQQQVVRAVTGSRATVMVVRAAAGTGKTFALDAARELWQQEGIPVAGCALSARAALELEDQTGIPSVTVAAVKQSLEQGRRLPNRGVLVVDEAGMVGTRDLARLARATDQAAGKLVLVGDDRQLPEIQAGGAFHALADRLPAQELKEVRRQRHAWDRKALDALRNGDVEEWARAYREHGRITVADNALAARAAMVNDWSRADGETVMIAARRADVADLNHRARSLLQAEGRLGTDEIQTTDRAFARGDRVIGTRNDRTRGILNGQRGTITSIDQDSRSIRVQLDGRNEPVTLDHGFLQQGHVEHGYAVTAHRAQGATVDEAFVLGSQDLYRELGYTALSRHREQARFYIAAADLEAPDHPELDPLACRLEILLGRSRTQQLAHDSLRDTDKTELAREREQLRADLEANEPPSSLDLRQLETRREQAAKRLEADDRHIERLEAQRARTRMWQLAERGRIDASLAQARERRLEQHADLQTAALAYSAASEYLTDWITRHGPDADRYISVHQHATDREAMEGRAKRRQDLATRPADWADRGLEHLGPEPDLGADLGL